MVLLHQLLIYVLPMPDFTSPTVNQIKSSTVRIQFQVLLLLLLIRQHRATHTSIKVFNIRLTERVTCYSLVNVILVVL